MIPVDARLAAQLLGIDPAGLGGVLLRGGPGPRRDDWMATLRTTLPAGAPMASMPAHIDDDRLLGGLDLGATLQAGRPIARRGLLAQSDGGIVLVPMAERMTRDRAAHLASALDTREVVIEREGLSGRLPARVGVVAFDEGIDGEEAVPPALVERLAMIVDLRAPPGDGDRAGHTSAVDDLRTAIDAPPRTIIDDTVTRRADAARGRLPAIRCSDELLRALVQAADALGVGSMRAAWFAARIACVAAAWAGRETPDTDDAALAVRLVLAPRATRLPAPADDEAQEVEAPAANETSPPPASDADDPPPPDQPSPTRDEIEALAERVLEAAIAALPPDLLARLAGEAATAARAGAAGGRAGAMRVSRRRGRPYGSRRGDPRAGARLHLIDTLRAAAPWQAVRRRDDPRDDAPRVRVHRDDFHVTRYRQKRETTTVFVVDASGSAALNRLAEAKGAVELLLAECYVRRDRVALVTFRGLPDGAGADLLLAPTRSLVRAKRALAGLPGGGGTPLASGLELARRVVEDEARRGATPLVVMLSDGRANIARDGTPGRAKAAEDALAAARAWPALGVGVLWLDISPQPQESGRVLAQAMGARYLPLPHADARQVSKAVMGVAR